MLQSAKEANHGTRNWNTRSLKLDKILPDGRGCLDSYEVKKISCTLQLLHDIVLAKHLGSCTLLKEKM